LDAILLIDLAVAVVIDAIGANLGCEAIDEGVEIIAVSAATMPIRVTVAVRIPKLVNT